MTMPNMLVEAGSSGEEAGMRDSPSIVEAAKMNILKTLEKSKRRMLKGADIDHEFQAVLKDVEAVMSELDKDVRLIINSYW